MPPPKDSPVGNGTPYCPSARYENDRTSFEFPVGTDLSVIQTTYGDESSRGTVHVQTVGEIRLRKLPKDTKHGNQAYFTVDVSVSDPKLEVIRSWDENSRLLKISTPRNARVGLPGPHCVSLVITAWFPEDAKFTNLLIESVTLAVRVIDDIKIKVLDRSKFATVTGHVSFPKLSLLPSILESQVGSTESKCTHPFSSRRILVETVSGTIDGTYPLMDYLGLRSQSGSISVGLLPQDALPSAPMPATLEVQTTSSSIYVELPVRDSANPRYTPPPRNYTTQIHSTSGGITGSYYLGTVSNFKSTSGSLGMTLLPVLPGDSSEDTLPNIFETYTLSGGTQIQILDPIFISHLFPWDEQREQEPYPYPHTPVGDEDPYLIIPDLGQSLFKIENPSGAKEKPLRTLKSTHSSTSGTISVQYPSSWEGNMHAKTMSGGISATGDGLKTISRHKGIVYNEVVARKGVEDMNEGCMIEMSDISGSLYFSTGIKE